MKKFCCFLSMSLILAATALAGAADVTANDDAANAPLSARSSGDLTGSHRWEWNHDRATRGSSVGSSSYPISNPSLYGAAREFHVSYWRHGGEIYHLQFARDEAATHFIYDTYIYLADPSQIRALELDMNQVLSNGRTVIFGTQCSSISGRWEFTTARGNKPYWHPSNIACNPKAWEANRWHHVQIASHRDGGVVTYDWVSVDGRRSNFAHAVGNSALSLGWTRGDLLLNLQLDGASEGTGEIRAYADKLTIFRW